MTIYIASDHAGFALKEELVGYIRNDLGLPVEDMGAYTLEPEDDYTDLIMPCAKRVADEDGALGIVIGGSGQGEAMAANRIPGARCALYYGASNAVSPIDAEGAVSKDPYDIVRLARRHNNANLLSIGARFVSVEDAKEAVRAFISTDFSGDARHVRRIGKLG